MNTFFLAAQRQGYRARTLHMRNGWATRYHPVYAQLRFLGGERKTGVMNT